MFVPCERPQSASVQDQFLQHFGVVVSSCETVISEMDQQGFLQYLAPDQGFLGTSQAKRPSFLLCWQSLETLAKIISSRVKE